MVTSMHLLAAALLFVGPPPGDTLAGRVTDSDGAPVPSAAVLISELHRVATSGTDGAFRLADVPPGEYTVIVRHVGFAPFARAVAVHGPTNLTVMLRRAPVWVEPVTITATRDRKSTRLNSSHSQISYAVFCLKKKKDNRE